LAALGPFGYRLARRRSGMRRRLWVPIFLLVLACPARSDPPAVDPEPTPEQAADAVIAAVKAGDAATLKEWAERRKPDPWIVADEVLGRGETGPADVFARQVQGPAGERLAKYVASDTAKAPAAEARKALSAANAALAAEKSGEALAALEKFSSVPSSVLGVRILVARALARHAKDSRALAGDDLEAASKVAGSIGWAREETSRLRDAAGVAFDSGTFASARLRFEQLRALFEATDKRLQAAASGLNLAVLAAKTGDYPGALRLYERTRDEARRAGDEELEWNAVSDAAEVRARVGEYAAAFADQVRARDVLRRIDADGYLAAQAQWRIGHVHFMLGENERALAAYDVALAEFERLGNVQAQGWAMGDRALCLQRLGQKTHAVEALTRARRLFEQGEFREDEMYVALNVAQWATDDGQWDEAIEKHLDVLKKTEGTTMVLVRAHAMEGLARARVGSGRVDVGVEDYRRALEEAQRLEAYDVLVAVRSGLAKAEALRGNDAVALSLALEAAHEAARGPRGLPEGTGRAISRVRAQGYEAGLLAARRTSDLSRMHQLLEAGRARQLLEGVGGRERIRSITTDPGAASAEAAAVAAEAEALARYREALGGNERGALAKARGALTISRRRTQEAMEATDASERMRGLAGLLQPQRRTIDDLRKRVEEGRALVYYAVSVSKPFALLVERGSARVVDLDPTGKVASALAAASHVDSRADSTKKLHDLKALIADPLALGKHIHTVLVCPDEATARLPLSALWPERAVCYVPSGTTYDLLLEDRTRRGKGYLAVGNPVYSKQTDPVHPSRAGSLTALPESEEEAKIVASAPSDDVLLLRDRANKDEVRSNLAAKFAAGGRWASVHFACHGLLDPADPAHSSLALTATTTDSGLLTSLEVLRLRVSADLVVLSACDTAGDEYTSGEGLQGLVRAFMFAGSPRVVAGLWKVDEAATKTFMTAFYEAWKSGKPAAESLRAAQGVVRGHDAWRHPAYWAPWVLWGLPD
jgi:CHAT domain-containing protein/tetratricopeptide (TPR) repeat protein